MCKKRNLFEIAANYKLPVSTAWVKGELKADVLTSLGEGVLVVLGLDSPDLVAAGKDQGRLILLLMWGELGQR